MHPDVTEYEQTVTPVGDDDVYESVEFSVVDPLLVLKNKTACVLTQTGQAVTWFARMKPPDPLPPSPVFIAKPKVTYRRLRDKPFAWLTTWEYVMAVDASFLSALDVEAAQAWPATPEFF